MIPGSKASAGPARSGRAGPGRTCRGPHTLAGGAGGRHTGIRVRAGAGSRARATGGGGRVCPRAGGDKTAGVRGRGVGGGEPGRDCRREGCGTVRAMGTVGCNLSAKYRVRTRLPILSPPIQEASLNCLISEGCLNSDMYGGAKEIGAWRLMRELDRLGDNGLTRRIPSGRAALQLGLRSWAAERSAGRRRAYGTTRRTRSRGPPGPPEDRARSH